MGWIKVEPGAYNVIPGKVVVGLELRDLDEKKFVGLFEQICAATGGPCTYSGRDMKSVHKGMGIGEADWNATIEDLTKSLRKFKVPRKEQKELLALLAPMKGDIVEAH